ncbi:hypothetical protein AB4305_03270 [Nocardia sp. 2YAB30]
MNGDPGKTLGEAVGDPASGIYPWPIELAYLVPADRPITEPGDDGYGT